MTNGLGSMDCSDIRLLSEYTLQGNWRSENHMKKHLVGVLRLEWCSMTMSMWRSCDPWKIYFRININRQQCHWGRSNIGRYLLVQQTILIVQHIVDVQAKASKPHALLLRYENSNVREKLSFEVFSFCSIIYFQSIYRLFT